MPPKEKTPSEVGREYCRMFPDSPTMTLAKNMYSKNKEVFSNLEHARTVIRRIRGQSGQKKIQEMKDKSLIKPLTYKYNPIDLPESHAESYEPFVLSQSKILILPDLHIPYQDNTAIDVAIRYGLKKEVNTILIDGDLQDFHWQSRFEKDPRARSTKQEFDATRKFLELLRNTFPQARIIFKQGNHDERWEKWLYLKAPEIFDDPEFTQEGRLKLAELKIEIVKDKQIIKIGKLNVLHGHELQGGVAGVNSSRAVFNKTIANVLVGHGHRTSRHVEPTLEGDVIVTNSMGCLCGLWPAFARVNKWQHGFAYVEHDIKTGEYNLENLMIIKGKVY